MPGEDPDGKSTFLLLDGRLRLSSSVPGGRLYGNRSLDSQEFRQIKKQSRALEEDSHPVVSRFRVLVGFLSSLLYHLCLRPPFFSLTWPPQGQNFLYLYL